jgi:uncharacterized protein YdcH (DUF465 family)
MQHSTENPATGLNQLLAEHRALDARVNELERQLHLTADEEREMHNLKKMKLAKKDHILAMQVRDRS